MVLTPNNQSPSTPKSQLPFITVILPIRNESRYIESSLSAILSQDYPLNHMEIIVADGMSTDGTRGIVQGFQQQNANIRMIDNPGMIVSTGLNTALRLVQNEIIIRVDGHCEIAPDYVRRCVQHLQQYEVGGVGGSIQTIGETFIAQAIADAISSSFGVGDSAFRITTEKTKLVDTVPFPAYTWKIMEHAGAYDEELVRNQDDEYNYRLRELGANILLASDVRSKYYSRSSLSSLWGQYFQYGFWKIRVFQKHPRQMRPRQFVPSLFVASLLTTGLLTIFHPLCRYLLGLIIVLYLLADLAASLWISSRRGWRYFPLLPLIFPILHLSYGLGFLLGLVKFANRWNDKIGNIPPVFDSSDEKTFSADSSSTWNGRGAKSEE